MGFYCLARTIPSLELGRYCSWLRICFFFCGSCLGFCLVIVALDRFLWMVWTRRIWERRNWREKHRLKLRERRRKSETQKLRAEPGNFLLYKSASTRMLVLHKLKMIPSNMRKKNKRTTECNKSTVTCDVGTVQCEAGTVKCEKKK